LSTFAREAKPFASMTSGRFEPELIVLRKLAEELAAQRKERVTSAHLLAAIAHCPSAESDLLHERRLTSEVVLRVCRSSSDDVEDPVKHALQRARELARRMGAPSPGGAHVLVALLSEPRGAARRALDQCGVDVSRLRSAALMLGQGLVTRRRSPRAEQLEPERTAAKPVLTRTTPKRTPTGVAVPLVPAEKRSAPNRPSRSGAERPPSAVTEPSGADETATPVPLLSRRPSPSLSPRARRGKPSATQAAAARFELDEQRFPTLCGLGRNLTLAAARGELDPVVGREREIEQALDVLAKREQNNPLLLGRAGVGKTSVVRGLARRIAEAHEVASLDDRIVIEIPVTELVAGTAARGSLALRLGAIRREVAAIGPRVVLFFDEIHQLFSGDAAEEIAADLKLALAKGELPCIGATTFEEHKRIFETDAALSRRFSIVEVDEPSREDAYLVLSGLSAQLERHHQVRYSEEALALAIAWSIKYLPGRVLPDKAIGIIDLAGARARRRDKRVVDPEAVAEVVAELADMPSERLLESDAERLLRLEEILAERVVGHSDAMTRIARILRRDAAGLAARRPIGTFLLLGPTGVGKTETAKAVAEVLFFNESALTRVDLSEYSEPHSVARLIGAPPGYVGHDAGGQLTEAVRRRPYQVILLDEIEKAHPDVLTAFLAVFDEGRMTDGRGRTVDFTNAVILMTSNIGAEETGSAARRRVGFGLAELDRADLERRVTAAARGALAPELYNRIDEVIVFSPLNRGEVRQVARRLLAAVGRALEQSRGIGLEVEEAAIDYLLDAGGFDPTLGARPMRRTIARFVEAPLAERVLSGELGRGDVALVSFDNGQLSFDVLDGSGSDRAAE
jgi:ATP-dependent Clp protease ATP-binding subunit ClpC